MPAPAHSAAYAFPVSVKGVAVQGGRVLLLENERNEWELPGGKLELREDPADCVVREIREEAGWKVTAGPFLDVHPACRWVVGFRSLVGAACQDDPGGSMDIVALSRRLFMDRRAEIGVAVPGVVEQTKAEIRFALNQLAARNGQHEFETLSRMLARAADKLGAPYKDLVDDAIAGAGVSGLLGSFIDGLSGKGPLWWDEMDTDQHVAHIVQQLGRPPFADAGPHRRVRFQCLGVTWAIEFGNHEPDVAVGERFAATLQITLAHLALADPALLPTSVKVLVTAGTPGTDLAIEQVDSTPTETCFRCTLAATEHRSREVHNTVAQQTLAAVATVIVTVSTLPDDQWKLLLDQAFEQDLPSITTFAMPYDAALHGTIRNHHLDLALDEQRPLVGHDTTCPDTAPGLEFPSTPGPGYTRSHSHDEVRFKYEDLPRRMRPTLAALRQAPAFADTVAVLRGRGWLDWHVLLATHGVAKNARLRFRSPHSPDDLEAVRELFLAIEPEDDPVPLRFFSVAALEQALQVTLPASATTMWKLTLRQHPIDIDAARRLLITRYGWASDDIEHDDPFRP